MLDFILLSSQTGAQREDNYDHAGGINFVSISYKI